MKKALYLLLLFSYGVSFSQNVTIDYETWTPPTGCRVFETATNVAATIGGVSSTISHQSLVGQPEFNTTVKAISMGTIFEAVGSITKGTRYKLAYSFKVGYSYLITATASANVNTEGFATGPYLRLELSNNPNGQNGTACLGPTSITSNLGSGTYQLPKNTFINFEYLFSPTTAQSMLEVSAFPANNGGAKTIYLRKITIVETPPAVSFNLSSSTQSITCGETNPITFTVNNTGSTPATGYTWNLGPTPNGWLLNGSPAPATYTTNTANTLTLTPDCGKALSNVSATVTTSTGSFTTNTATVATTQNFAINGSNTICANPETYSVGTLPCNTTVSWQVSPNSGVVSHAASGSDYILTRTGTGTVTLTANITTACGATVPPINKTITVQNTPPNPTSATMFNYQQVTGEKFAEYEILPNVPGATYVVTPSVQNNTYYFVNGNIVEIVYPCINAPGTFTGTVKIQNGCGISAGSVTINRSFSVCDGGGGRERIGRSIRVSSNAGMSNATISVFENETGKPVDIKWIQVLNKEGVLLKEYKYDNGVKQALLSLGNLKPDVYIIRAFDGTAWSSTKISIN